MDTTPEDYALLRMRDRRQFLKLAVGTSGMMLLAACTSAAPSTPTSAPAPAPPTSAPAPAAQTTKPAAVAATTAPAASGGTIKFAAVGPMTGTSADSGLSLRRGVELAMKEINAGGGIAGKTVAVDFYDDEAKPESAASVAQKIVSDSDVFAVIGHVNSSCVLAALPLYSKAGLTEVAGSASAPKITQLGYKSFFRINVNDSLAGPQTVQLAAKLGKKRAAIIYENTDYGKGLLDASRDPAKAAGVEIVDEDTYTLGVDKDFAAILTKAKAANPDVMIHYGSYGEGGPMVGQAAKLGLNLQWLVDGDQDPAFIDLAGKPSEGVISFSGWDQNADLPVIKTFNTKMQPVVNRLANEWEAYHYDIPFIYKAAIEKGASKATLPQVLHTLKYDGVTGHTEFDDNGDVVGKQLYLLVVKDGLWQSYKPA
jgi:branched-chain amino acid transport system substrate-binding protein